MLSFLHARLAVADTPACVLWPWGQSCLLLAVLTCYCGLLLAAAAADGAQPYEGDTGSPGGREEGEGGEAHGGAQVRAPATGHAVHMLQLHTCLPVGHAITGGLWCVTGGCRLPAVCRRLVPLCPAGRSKRRSARPRASSGCAWRSMTTCARSSSAATAHGHSRARCAAVVCSCCQRCCQWQLNNSNNNDGDQARGLGQEQQPAVAGCACARIVWGRV